MLEKESRKYDYVCVGFSKTGTTTIWDVLGTHPQICKSKYKELFVANPSYLLEEDILRFFSPKQKTKVLIEATPWFLLKEVFKPVLESIKKNQTIGKIKCIFVLRDHIKRNNSSLLNCIMNHRKEIIDGEIKSHPNIFHTGGVDHFLRYYSNISTYYSSMVFLEKEYGKENILFLKLEDLNSSDKKINNFLEIEDFKYKWCKKNDSWNKSITIEEVKLYNNIINKISEKYLESTRIIEDDKKKIFNRYGIRL